MNTFQILPDRLALLDAMPKNSVCAEIGVQTARYSLEIKRRTQPQCLYLVDPWAPEPSAMGLPQPIGNALYNGIVQHFKNDNSVKICRQTSDTFFAQHPHPFLDWLYVDGDHSYPASLADFQHATTALKSGGILCSHDFNLFPVKRAIFETINTRLFAVRYMTNEPFFQSIALQKLA